MGGTGSNFEKAEFIDHVIILYYTLPPRDMMMYFASGNSFGVVHVYTLDCKPNFILALGDWCILL